MRCSAIYLFGLGDGKGPRPISFFGVGVRPVEWDFFSLLAFYCRNSAFLVFKRGLRCDRRSRDDR